MNWFKCCSFKNRLLNFVSILEAKTALGEKIKHNYNCCFKLFLIRFQSKGSTCVNEYSGNFAHNNLMGSFKRWKMMDRRGIRGVSEVSTAMAFLKG